MHFVAIIQRFIKNITKKILLHASDVRFGTLAKTTIIISLVAIVGSCACGRKIEQNHVDIPPTITPFKISSDALGESGDMIQDPKYLCAPGMSPVGYGKERINGVRNTSPDISWDNAPNGAASVVIILELKESSRAVDSDCVLKYVTDTGEDQKVGLVKANCIQWQIYDIDPAKKKIPQIVRETNGNIKSYIEQRDKKEFGEVGPNYRYKDAAQGYKVTDGASPSTDLDVTGNYYLAPCPSGGSRQTSEYNVSVYVMKEKTGVPPDIISSRDFESKFKDKIMTYDTNDEDNNICPSRSTGLNGECFVKDEISFTIANSRNFTLVSSNIRNGEEIHSSEITCGENPFANPGIAPDLSWFNPPTGAYGYALFLEDETSKDLTRVVNAPSAYKTYPTLSATQEFAINNNTSQNIGANCDLENCRHWALFGLTPVLIEGGSEVNIGGAGGFIPRGGLSPKQYQGADRKFSESLPYFEDGQPRDGFVFGRNLFSHALRVTNERMLASGKKGDYSKATSTLSSTASLPQVVLYRATDNGTMTVAAKSTSMLNKYFGPCAPVGSGTRRYRFTLMALSEKFYTKIWNAQGPTRNPSYAILGNIEENSGVNAGKRASKTKGIRSYISALSSENFRYYFGGKGNTEYPPVGSNADPSCVDGSVNISNKVCPKWAGSSESMIYFQLLNKLMDPPNSQVTRPVFLMGESLVKTGLQAWKINSRAEGLVQYQNITMGSVKIKVANYFRRPEVSWTQGTASSGFGENSHLCYYDPDPNKRVNISLITADRDASGHLIPKSCLTRYEFFNRLGDASYLSGSLAKLTSNLILDETSLVFYFNDENSCELCKFCLIGQIPSAPGSDLWQHYGHSVPYPGNQGGGGIFSIGGSNTIPNHDVGKSWKEEVY